MLGADENLGVILVRFKVSEDKLHFKRRTTR